MLERMAEDRRRRRETAPEAPAGPGEQWGTCVGVHEVGDRRRKVARVLLASGMVITAYLPLNAIAPAIESPVLVQTRAIGDPGPGRGDFVTAIGDQPGHGDIVAR
jgi:ribosomal protein S12